MVISYLNAAVLAATLVVFLAAAVLICRFGLKKRSAGACAAAAAVGFGVWAVVMPVAAILTLLPLAGLKDDGGREVTERTVVKLTEERAVEVIYVHSGDYKKGSLEVKDAESGESLGRFKTNREIKNYAVFTEKREGVWESGWCLVYLGEDGEITVKARYDYITPS